MGVMPEGQGGNLSHACPTVRRRYVTDAMPSCVVSRGKHSPAQVFLRAVQVVWTNEVGALAYNASASWGAKSGARRHWIAGLAFCVGHHDMTMGVTVQRGTWIWGQEALI